MTFPSRTVALSPSPPQPLGGGGRRFGGGVSPPPPGKRRRGHGRGGSRCIGRSGETAGAQYLNPTLTPYIRGSPKVLSFSGTPGTIDDE